jgi:lipopolysaccharide/colanic/teichoic acid biosynthesis glycosyltransferase
VTDPRPVPEALHQAGTAGDILGDVPIAAVIELNGAIPRHPQVSGRGEERRWTRLRPAAKRVFDVVGSVASLVLSSPVLIVTSLAVLVSEGRPVIYCQTRVGRDGKPFTMLKFRTMVHDAHDRLDEVRDQNHRTGPLFKAHEDPRVTRVGRFLRITSLDELPQLLNVLQGSMSLVGPRPALYEERENFPAELLERETVRPGITGLWQVEARLDPDFDRYHELDLEYVRTYTLGRDIGLLLRTPIVVSRDAWRHRHGASPATASSHS